MPSIKKFSSVQSHSRVWLFVTPWTAKHQAFLSITNSQSFLNLMSIQLVMSSILSTHLLMSTHPLSSSSPPAFNLSQHQGLFQCHNRWSKYWSFSFNISPSNTYSGLISFRMDWMDFLAVQGTLKSLLQYHSSKASSLLCSAFFIVQLSHLYMTTGKTIALTKWTSVDKVMSLFFNMLSSLVTVGYFYIFYFHGCSHHLQWYWNPRK